MLIRPVSSPDITCLNPRPSTPPTRLAAGQGKPSKTSSAVSTPLYPSLAMDLTTDRKSTRLNSSHSQISYAVFCLKKKTARVRKFDTGDVEQVLELAQKYASWDATPTKADIEGFHSASPEFFFVAEVDKRIVGFISGRESNPPAEVLDKWNSRKVASIETLAVDENHR